jgi:sugar lactone lactonase YvrE
MNKNLDVTDSFVISAKLMKNELRTEAYVSRSRRESGLAAIVSLLGLGSLLATTSPVFGDVVYVAEEQLTRVSIIQNGSIQPLCNAVGLVYGLAIDSSGNIYAAGTGDDTIRKVTPNGVVSVYASSSVLGSPGGLAFDSFGNLYTSGGGYGGTVNKITPSGAIIHVASGTFGFGLAFDKNGDLYVSSGTSVSKITPSGATSTFASGFDGAWGLAFDQSGDLFVANYLGNSISKVSPDGTVSLFASGLDLPTGLAFDSNGDLYVCNVTQNGPGNLCRITPDGNVTEIVTGLDDPTAIAIQVPEPSTTNLWLLGLMAVLQHFRRRRTKIPKIS